MNASRRVLRYLKGTTGCGILLSADNALQLHGFCDSDWGACPLSRCSLTSYFVTLGNSPISWKTKKQTTVSRSSTEAEYRSMAVVTSELVRIRSFLASLGIFHTKPMKLSSDNQASHPVAKNPVFHEHTKHMELDCHFVRESLEAGLLGFSYIKTQYQQQISLLKPPKRSSFST